MQHPQRQADHLQILAPRRGRDVPGFGADVVDDGFLQPRDEEVRAFVDDGLFDSGQTVEYDGARAAFDVVHGGLDEGAGDGDGHGPFVDCAQGVGHGGGFCVGYGSRWSRWQCCRGALQVFGRGTMLNKRLKRKMICTGVWDFPVKACGVT